MKKIAYLGFALALLITSCKKDDQKPEAPVTVKNDYALKLENVLPVTLQQYMYPISSTVTEPRTIYLVQTIAAKNSDITAVLADLDKRGWKPTVINYAIKAVDQYRDQVVKITVDVSNVNSEWFYSINNDQETVQFFYHDSTGASVDNRWVSTKEIAANASYAFVEKK